MFPREGGSEANNHWAPLVKLKGGGRGPVPLGGTIALLSLVVHTAVPGAYYTRATFLVPS